MYFAADVMINAVARNKEVRLLAMMKAHSTPTMVERPSFKAKMALVKAELPGVGLVTRRTVSLRAKSETKGLRDKKFEKKNMELRKRERMVIKGISFPFRRKILEASPRVSNKPASKIIL